MRLFALPLLTLSLACAHVEPGPAVEDQPVVATAPPPAAPKVIAPPAPKPPARDLRVARVARRYLKNKPKLKRNDCSGLVISVLRELDVEVRGGTKQMWERAVREKRVRARPQAGDLAFFDHTWDKNKNGRVDDPLSHVAIVTDVDGDQVEMVHKIPSGIRRLRLNLRDPATWKSGGAVMNDYLRAPRFGPKGGPRMAGQLLRGFARPPTGGSLAAR
jgi:hypothetical protein